MNVYQMLAYESARTLFGPWLSFTFRISSEGSENIPRDGGALLICNHKSTLDPIALMTEIDRYIHFIAGSKGFIIPNIRTLYHMTGMVKLSGRAGSRPGRELEDAVRLMKDGEIVGIFPEGIGAFMRPDGGGRIRYFRTGFARLALEAGVPIIPVAVVHHGELKANGARAGAGKLARAASPSSSNGRMLIRVGRPVDLDRIANDPITKNTIDTLSGKLRRIVIKLHDGEDLDRFVYGNQPFDILTDRV